MADAMDEKAAEGKRQHADPQGHAGPSRGLYGKRPLFHQQQRPETEKDDHADVVAAPDGAADQRGQALFQGWQSYKGDRLSRLSGLSRFAAGTVGRTIETEDEEHRQARNA